MKILHIAYSDHEGGASRAAIRIHKSLVLNKVKSYFQINTFSKNKKIKNILKPTLIKILINKLKYLLEGFITKVLIHDKFSKNSLSLFPTFYHKEINLSNYDIIHLHWINAETMSIEDIGKIKKPIVWTIQDMWPLIGSEHYKINRKFTKVNGETNNFSKIIEKRKLKNWNNQMYLVTPSDWLKNCALKSNIMKKFSVETIYNPLDVDFWKPEKKKNCKKFFNLPTNEKFIGFSSIGKNNNFLKGKDLFLKSLKHLSKYKKKISVLTTGDFNEFTTIDENIKIYNLGKIKDDKVLKYFYNTLDLIVVPSRLEAFGQTASEANSCGIPVVSFNNSGLKNIIVHKKNGWLAKPFNTQDLAKGMLYILNLDKANYRKMQSHSIKNCIDNFSFKKISRQYYELYCKIIKENNSLKI